LKRAPTESVVLLDQELYFVFFIPYKYMLLLINSATKETHTV